MPIGLFGFGYCCEPAEPKPPRPMRGKSRGVTKSPRRAKRRNRRKS